MRIGILGGTFDPIHRAHEALGHAACREFCLDYILVMPTGNSYLKAVQGRQVTSAKHREAMVKCSIANDPMFRYSDMEIRREGNTYTAETLQQLHREQPENTWYFIVGADSLAGMKDWYEPEIIFANAEIIVARRGDQVEEEILQRDIDYLSRQYRARIHRLNLPECSISSSNIRKEILQGRLPHPDLESAVNEYIQEHGLYGSPQSAEQILESLRRRLKPSRVEHTIGVANTAKRMAKAMGHVDPEQAYLAGILHDCGKSEGTALTHAPIGARIAREEYGIQDEDILSAIRWHTTGRPEMSELEKIIFIADYIEPGRDRAPRLEELRRLAYENPDKTIVCILEDTLSYLRDSGANIDEQSLKTYNYYANKLKREEAPDEHIQGDAEYCL